MLRFRKWSLSKFVNSLGLVPKEIRTDIEYRMYQIVHVVIQELLVWPGFSETVPLLSSDFELHILTAKLLFQIIGLVEPSKERPEP